MKKKHMYDTEYVSQTPPDWAVKEDDRRYKKYARFRERHGFWPEECWNLDYAIFTFTLPRLRFLRRNSVGCYPGMFKSWEKWAEVLDAMIWSMEQCVEAPGHGCPTDKTLARMKMTREESEKKVNKGLRLFRKNVLRLGW